MSRRGRPRQQSANLQMRRSCSTDGGERELGDTQDNREDSREDRHRGGCFENRFVADLLTGCCLGMKLRRGRER
jgi:hypothetical protein